MKRSTQSIGASACILAAAAFSGMMAGSAQASTAGVGTASARVLTMVDPGQRARHMDGATTQQSPHDCKGQNACKGQGGCKTASNSCKGQNACKGQGGCKTSGQLL